MILYNVTLAVDPDIETEWVTWMQDVHIPDVLQSGCFLGYRMCRLHATDPAAHPTYTIQYELTDQTKLDEYQAKFAPALQRDHLQRYGDQVAAYRSLMTVIASDR